MIKKSNKMITIWLTSILILSTIGLVSQVNADEPTPTITFIADGYDHEITIASTESGVLWSNISISGIYNASSLGTYVTAGDQITECYGEVSLVYIPSGATLFTFTFSDPPSTPSISFTWSDLYNEITVTTVDPDYVSWSDILISGTCDSSALGTWVTPGDKITSCYGPITILFLPTNEQFFSYLFSSTPSITFTADYDDHLMTVASTESNVLWSDIEFSGSCDISGLGTYVTAGDVITDCYGTITVIFSPISTLIATFEFSDSSSTPSISFIKNEYDDTLTVTSVSQNDLSWSDVMISCTDESETVTYILKIGTIKAGDIIDIGSASYFGFITVRLTWKPTSTILYETTFYIASVEQGWISGTVYQSKDTNDDFLNMILLINDAEICVYSSSGSMISCTQTDNLGRYSISVDPGIYTVTAYKEGYSLKTEQNVEVEAGEGTHLNFELSKISVTEFGWIYGQIYETVKSGNISYSIPLRSATICIYSTGDNTQFPFEICSSFSSSAYPYIFNITSYTGNVRVTVSKEGYYPSTKYVTVEADKGTEINFYLKKKSPSADMVIHGRVFGLTTIDDNIASISALEFASVSIRKIGDILVSESDDFVVITSPVLIKSSSLNSNFVKYDTSKIPIKTGDFWRFTTTDENGDFIFDNLEEGRYEIRVAKYGYTSESDTIDLEDESVEVTFTLEKIQSIDLQVGVIKIIPIDESKLEIREIIGASNLELIDNAIVSGTVGGEILISNDLENDAILYNNLLSFKSVSIDKNEISLIISGDESLSGKTLVINAETGFFDNEGNLLIKYDGETIRLADDINDVLNPNDDGSFPEYLIVEGALGVQIIISIPHFSDHEISITSLADVIEAVGGLTAFIMYIVICAVTAVIFIGSIKIRKKL
jgi:hypothetical protein